MEVRRGDVTRRHASIPARLVLGLLVIAAASCTGGDPESAPVTSTTPGSSTVTIDTTTTTTAPPTPPMLELIDGAVLEIDDMALKDPCPADPVAGVRVTPHCVDPDLGEPFIDEDELRDIEDPKTGEMLSYRYVHGGFDGSAVRFALHFPTAYAGRFFQSTYPTVGFERVSDRDLAQGLRHGAIVVASNNAGGVTASPALGGVRANAAAAIVTHRLVPQLYGDNAPVRGYIYGASGGAYQAIGALESTEGIWDGAVPIVPGTSNAIPSFMTAQLLGLRLLGDHLDAIVDAVEPGGSGDPFIELDPEPRAILEEVTGLGFPLEGWWQHENLKGGAFGLVQLAVRGIDPAYADDFWSTPGYEGADPDSPIHDHRLLHETTVEAVDGRRVALRDVPAADLFGADLVVVSGRAAGSDATVTDSAENTLTLDADLGGLAIGDRVRIDNSWFLALHYYHRYQVPDAGQHGWDGLRHPDGEPIHPQRPSLVGPIVADVFGSRQTGSINGHMIVLASLNDVEAFAWAADWYATRVREALGDDADDRFRLWYLENADHITRPDPTHVIDYAGVVEQALLDLDAWVANGTPPPAGTNYEIGERTEIVVPAEATERRGIQPVIEVLTGPSACGQAAGTRVEVGAGEEFSLAVSAATPPGSGKIIDVEWDLDGSGQFTGTARSVEPSTEVDTCATHRFEDSGTRFVTVRVTSHREGDPDAVDGRIVNIARIRVVVS